MPRDKPIRLPGTFEEALSDLLKVKPATKSASHRSAASSTRRQKPPTSKKRSKQKNG
jgi:hypothetical protein